MITKAGRYFYYASKICCNKVKYAKGKIRIIFAVKKEKI